MRMVLLMGGQLKRWVSPLGHQISSFSTRCAAPSPKCTRGSLDALSPVLVSENVTYADGTTPVDVARIHYRGDRFTFAISLDIP